MGTGFLVKEVFNKIPADQKVEEFLDFHSKFLDKIMFTQRVYSSA